ncbi:MAG: pseudouridine synthase [Phycisphaera sp.]|nr:pseudouridine synthase [Phycisphaera sp.]
MTRNKRTKKVVGKDPLHDAAHGTRLNKALAQLGVASRRAADQLIAEGHVMVNGKPVTEMPAWVDLAKDRIQVDGVTVNKTRKAGHIYLMINKPRGVISTNDDPEGRRTVLDLLPHSDRLFCVGRLDAESTGLVLMTDDGPLANHLMHPRYEVPKTYLVTVRGELADADIAKLHKGILLSEKRSGGMVKAKAEAVRLIKRDRERTRLEITLTEGRNREIRRMLARRGHKVRRLQRVALGPLRLKGVAAGDWRALTRAEVFALRKLAKD